MLNSLTMNNLKIRGTKKTIGSIALILILAISLFRSNNRNSRPLKHYMQLPFQQTLG